MRSLLFKNFFLLKSCDVPGVLGGNRVGSSFCPCGADTLWQKAVCAHEQMNKITSKSMGIIEKIR